MTKPLRLGCGGYQVFMYVDDVLKDKTFHVNLALDNHHLRHYFIGNWLDDACKYSPGNSPHVINVGSTVIENGIDVLYKTNHGSCVTLYAPGQSK